MIALALYAGFLFCRQAVQRLIQRTSGPAIVGSCWMDACRFNGSCRATWCWYSWQHECEKTSTWHSVSVGSRVAPIWLEVTSWWRSTTASEVHFASRTTTCRLLHRCGTFILRLCNIRFTRAASSVWWRARLRGFPSPPKRPDQLWGPPRLVFSRPDLLFPLG